jgi:orotidine-5'-phosphate decarboxylase
VLDAGDGAQRGGERGDDQAVEQPADLGSGQRDRPAVACVVPGIGGRAGAAAAALAIKKATASMARVMNRCQPVQVRT